MNYHSFHEKAARRFRLIDTDGVQFIELLFTAPRSESLQFFHTWNQELEKFAAPETLFMSQILTAFSLAATNADPAYQRHVPQRAALLSELVPEMFRQGPSREVYTEYGLFATPLPVGRMLLNRPDFTPDEMLVPVNGFAVSAIWIANVIRSFQSANSRPPFPYEIALHLHGSTFKDNPSNPYRIQYRGDFLSQFIAHFNASFPQKEIPCL